MSSFSLSKLEKSLHKVGHKLHKLPHQLSALKETVVYTFNPNHRHDEPHEKAIDERRAEIADSHRFASFADVQAGNQVKSYIDGHDFFWAISEILEGAQETIFILGWWISPELSLRRPPEQHEEYRLDRLLLRKAQQGVKIFIVCYKEVSAALSLASSHTKHALEALHPNIAVCRHPDHSGGDITLAWAHHEKVVVVDGIYATIGGLDLCFGRWDTHNAPLADVHPTAFCRTLFPGQDYNNARVSDFSDVKRWVANQTSKLDIGRMPWHDTHMMMIGPSVMDVAQHFVERYNFVRHLKYRDGDRYPMLAFPHVFGDGTDPIIHHPHYEAFRRAGDKFVFHSKPVEHGGSRLGGGGSKGPMRVQALRSSADWSMGILTEHSIQNAYIQMITEANHFVYIENQFFITATGSGERPVKNLIGKAIVDRVLSAARSGTKFKVVVVLPAIPGFAGDLDDGPKSTLVIMGETYNSICRGGHSIMEEIAAAGYDPLEYISFYSLRSYDRINSDPARLRKMTEASGVSYYQAEAAMARIFLGEFATVDELQKNQTVTFTLSPEGAETSVQIDKSSEPASKSSLAPSITLPLPTYEVALDQIRRFQAGDLVDERISDSVAHHALEGTGSLMEEAWSGTPQSELDAYVSEILYIHTKLLIVDDRRVLMGSANLNDRSQVGDHDSEIALVVEDDTELRSTMNGRPYIASAFAANLRRRLYRQHLGLIAPQFCPNEGEETPTSAMQSVSEHRVRSANESPEDALVADPLSDATIRLWTKTADQNTESFAKVFHCVPSKEVENWIQYKAYVPQISKVGHVHESIQDVNQVKQELDKIRGHLVTFPLNFLKQEDLIASDLTINPLTMAIYI